MRKISQKFIFIIFLITICIFFSATTDYIILTVNDQPITYLNFINTYKMYVAQAKAQKQVLTNPVKETLDYMIDDILISQDASSHGIKVTDDEINMQIEYIMKTYNLTIDQLSEELKKQGMDLNQFIENQRKQLLMYRYIQQVIEPKVKKPTKNDIENFYKENKEKFKGSYEYSVKSVKLIVPKNSGFKERLALKRKIDQYLKMIKESNQTITEENVRKFSSENQVTLIYEQKNYYPELIDEELADELENLKVGKISDVIEYNNDFYIFILESRREIDYIPFIEVVQKIYNYIYEQRKMELFQTTVDRLRKEAIIVWYVDINSIVVP
ncbi:MAG: peptidyl-prolyl cis-trans isomerase [Exilispira sp.]|nr:peptidyl-prolyl cis-trans isomerase [Exilispira sp.]